MKRITNHFLANPIFNSYRVSFATTGQLICKLLALFLIALALWAGPGSRAVFAAQVIVNCSDVNDSSTCRLQAQGSFSEETYNFVQDVLQVAGSNSANGACTQTSANTFDCQLPGATGTAGAPLTCLVQGNNASCEFTFNPALVDIDCQRNGQSGQCVLNTNPDAFAGTLDDQLLGNLVGLQSNLLTGCASLSGSSGFQADCAPLLDGLANNNASVVNTARAIAPVNSDAPIYSALNFVYTGLGHLHRRLVFLRQGQSTRSQAAVPASLRVRDDYAGYDYHLAELPSLVETPLTDAAGFSRLGIFVDASVLGTELSNQTFENGSDQTTGVLTWGVDYRFSSDFTAGIAFSTSNSSTDYNAGRGDLSDLGYLLLGFGSYYNGNLYVDTSVGVGGNQYEQTRVLRCDGEASCSLNFTQIADSNFSGRQFSYSLAAGYDFNFLQALTVTPFAQFSGTTVTIDSYRESASSPDSSGAGFVIAFDEQSRTTSLLSAGVRASYPVSTSSFVAVPNASLEIISAPNDDDLTVSGSFLGNQNQGEQFEISNRVVENSYMLANFGSVFQLRRGLSAFVAANIVFGNSRTDKFQLSSGFRWEL